MELAKLEGFDWDEGNQEKSLTKHGISALEAEEAFFNFYIVFLDPRHSETEPRFGMYGKTNASLILF